MPLSTLRANTSSRPALEDVTAGSAVSVPPNVSQSCHVPSNHLCWRVLSAPRAKRSNRPAFMETAAGSLTRLPNASQSCQEPSKCLCHKALSPPRMKRSRVLGPDVLTAGFVLAALIIAWAVADIFAVAVGIGVGRCLGLEGEIARGCEAGCHNMAAPSAVSVRAAVNPKRPPITVRLESNCRPCCNPCAKLEGVAFGL